MKKNLYTLIGIIFWIVILRLMLLIPGITEIDILTGACALILTKMVYIENNKKDN